MNPLVLFAVFKYFLSGCGCLFIFYRVFTDKNLNTVYQFINFPCYVSWSEPQWAHSQFVAYLCPTLCDPIDSSLPGSSVHGIFQARILEWVAISFSRRSSPPRNQMGFLHCRHILYQLIHQGSFNLFIFLEKNTLGSKSVVFCYDYSALCCVYCSCMWYILLFGY